MHRSRAALIVLLSLLSFMLLCRFSPWLSNGWTALVILPASGLLAGFTARASFPIV